ncbi:MAG: hypothetical protein LBC85_12375 [Fibromonadaceae bacterium]|jgi:hypothetical protein|nr:hypothetical protein [Fibromonadaceae bacterium]
MKRILLAVFCVIVCGCAVPPDCDNSLSYPHWAEWINGKLISIVNDSLAVLASNRYRKECKDGQEHITSSRSGLFLVNYRTKQKSLSIDTTIEIIFTKNQQVYDHIGDPSYYNNPYFRIVENYFKDSSVLVIDNDNNRFGFWKMGTEYVPFERYFYQEDYALSKANPWINGNILFKNSKKSSRNGEVWDKAPMLNTENRQITMLDFTSEYEWLNECLDVSYIGEKILCIKIKDAVTNKFELVVDGIAMDVFQSIYHSNCGKDENEDYRLPDCHNYAIALDGNYIIKEIRPRYLTIGSIHEVHKIDTETLKLSRAFTPMWIYDGYDGVRFSSDNFDNIDAIDIEKFILYTPRDLFEVGY